MQNMTLYYAFQIVLYILWMAVFAFLFEPRFRTWVMAVSVCLGFGVFFLIIYMPFLSFARFFAGAAVLVGITQLLFRGRWYAKLLLIAAELIVMILSEFLAFLMLPDGMQAETILSTASFEQMLVIYALDFFGNFILLGAIAVIARNFQKRYRGEVAGREWLLLLLFPVSQYFLLSGWYASGAVTGIFTNSRYLTAAILLCVAADVALAITLYAAAHNAELRARNALLEEQIDAQQSFYQHLSESYEQLRRLRHDIDNHLYTVKILLEEGRTAEARDYAEELQRSRKKDRDVQSCDNPVAASFLAHRAEELREKGIETELSVDLPRSVGVANSDLICALGNLLDNAAEACTAGGERRIRLSAHYTAPYLHLETQNAFVRADRKKDRRIPGLERGVGFAVLRHLAELYDGDFSHREENREFIVSLSLRGKTAAEEK